MINNIDKLVKESYNTNIMAIQGLQMKNLTDFENTKDLFNYLVSLLETQDASNVKNAGSLFEDFCKEWHLAFNDYIAVYDANDIDSIPSHVISKIDAYDLLSKGANSFAIDKICVSRTNEIDIHQDKGTIHIDKNLGTDKIAPLMSVRNNPLKNVRNYVINTMAKDLSHYSSLWKDQPPLVYGYDIFVPSDGDQSAIDRDKLFWLNLKNKNKGLPITNVYGFISRGPYQDEYINAGKEYGKNSLKISGFAKWHQLGTGSLGKSLLDPIILSELEYLFDPIYTSTPKPVSVSFYHSSKTLPKNGWEEVMRRRSKGLYDKVIIVSGTEVIDKDNAAYSSTPFEKTTSPIVAYEKIVEALENNSSVLLLTLYHHAEQISLIHSLLSKKYPGFKYWYRKRDECDWPCSNSSSSYAPALDNRTESILTFGSSGTVRLGEDPINDYGLNNINIHGPCAYNLPWSEAEKMGLVKPLILILPSIRESEVSSIFPEFVDKNGRVDWNLRVNGVPVDNTYPTARLIAELICLAKSLVEWPQVKRLLAFANFVKTNKLAEANWNYVCDKILDSDLFSQPAKSLFWQILNDDAYSTTPNNNHALAIKQAKGNDRYIIGSCRVFGRGYDDTQSPKHHASIHFDPKSEVNTVQEIWRTTRKDEDPSTGKPRCGDPYSYYILPLLINDIDQEPSISEERLEQLRSIFKHNRNISDTFESLVQTPSSRSKPTNITPKIWIPKDMDPNLIGPLVRFIAKNTKEEVLENLYVDAHNWLTEKYLQIDDVDIRNHKLLGQITEDFFSQEKFKPIFDIYKQAQTSQKAFKADFLSGKYILRPRSGFSLEVKTIISQNIIELNQHKKNCLQTREIRLSKIQNELRSRFKNLLYLNKKYWDMDALENEFGFPRHIIGLKCISPVIKELEKDKKHWINQQRKVYDILFETAECSSGQIEWAENTLKKFESNQISSYGIGRKIILSNFIRKDHFKLLNEEEWKRFRDLYESVKYKQYSKVAKVKESKKTEEDKDKISKKRLNTLFAKQGNAKTCKNNIPVIVPWGVFPSAGEAVKHPNSLVKYGRKIRENIKNCVDGYSYVNISQNTTADVDDNN